MKYLRRLNESVHDNLSEIKSIISDLEEEYNITADFSEVNYYITSKRSTEALSITLENEIDHISIDNLIKPILIRLKSFADSIDCGVHIDPDCKSIEFFDVEEFINEYDGEEMSMIDIIIYNRKYGIY